MLRCQDQRQIEDYPRDDLKGYFIHLSRSDIQVPAVRDKLQQISTGLTIPGADVTMTTSNPSLVEFFLLQFGKNNG